MREKDLFWWGRTSADGWLVLDRSDPRNRGNDTFFLIRCKDWQTIHVPRKEFGTHHYQWFMRHLRSLPEGRQQEGALAELMKLRADFLSRRVIVEFVRTCVQHKEYKAGWDSRSVYAAIADSDRRLARVWMGSGTATEQADATEARMLSARCAEKVAMTFYRSLAQDVADISIQQLKGESDEWKYYDVLVQREKKVDVKNARTPVNQKNRYVDHCVPKFKYFRGQDVKIGGVISPYLNLQDMLDVGRIYYDLRDIIFLGETDRDSICKLESHFSRRKITIQSQVTGVVPPWTFEFPPEYYSERNDRRRQLRTHGYNGIPTFDELSAMGLNPIYAFLSAGLELPSSWGDRMSEWEVGFYSALQPFEGQEMTMPVLFLSLLTHFLETASHDSPPSAFQPTRYRKFLFSGLEGCEQLPLGIFDPLGVISDFVSTLETLWNYKDTIRFPDYGSFRFLGLGLLSGIRSGTQSRETILAYCGGFGIPHEKWTQG